MERWNLTVHDGERSYPSWVEFEGEGGRFCGEVGSARPIPTVVRDGDAVSWRLPKQYEGRETDLEFRGQVEGDTLAGEFLNGKGEWIPFSGRRAAELPWRELAWGEPHELTETMDAWEPRTPGWESHWTLGPDGLDNVAVGSDLVTKDAFGDFRLVAEYRYPQGSNSGIYLRGRYEFQILDDYGSAPHAGGSGAIYGLLVPTENALKPAGEWNLAEIELVGRYVTVTLNGVKIHDRQEIAGTTGGALDSDEAMPGRLFVQGDHGPVTFRRLALSHPA